MDVDYLKNEMIVKSVPRESLFSKNTLRRLSEKLDTVDVVSLLYLMCDTQTDKIQPNPMAKIYQQLNDDFSSMSQGINFPDLCSKYIRDWPGKIIEALVEIQHFEALLDVFGVNKLDAIYNVNMNDRVLNANKIKIFKVCEGLDSVHKAVFLSRMEEVLAEAKLPIRMPPIRNVPYLEMYFMFWQCSDVITSAGKNFDLILKGLEATGVDQLLCLFTSAPLVLNDHTLSTYPIFNEKNIGLCVIVNQFLFENPDYNRLSSCADEKELRKVMESLNFDVECRHNLNAKDIPEVLKQTVNSHFKRNHHSMLFVAIMSHGEEGFVWGTDGIQVSLRTIASSLAIKALNQVPKVLVINACRGQNVFARGIYEADGPNLKPKEIRSELMDIVTCYSTLPGFISVRNKEKGSLFMHALCEVLDRRADLEVCEIFTIVNNSLMSPKDYRLYNPLKLAHPCEFNSRLLKKLYLKKCKT